MDEFRSGKNAHLFLFNFFLWRFCEFELNSRSFSFRNSGVLLSFYTLNFFSTTMKYLHISQANLSELSKKLLLLATAETSKRRRFQYRLVAVQNLDTVIQTSFSLFSILMRFFGWLDLCVCFFSMQCMILIYRSDLYGDVQNFS